MRFIKVVLSSFLKYMYLTFFKVVLIGAEQENYDYKCHIKHSLVCSLFLLLLLLLLVHRYEIRDHDVFGEILDFDSI